MERKVWTFVKAHNSLWVAIVTVWADVPLLGMCCVCGISYSGIYMNFLIYSL